MFVTNTCLEGPQVFDAGILSNVLKIWHSIFSSNVMIIYQYRHVHVYQSCHTCTCNILISDISRFLARKQMTGVLQE